MESISQGVSQMNISCAESIIGYVLQTNNNTKLVLVKENDRYWKTKWVDIYEKIQTPTESIDHIFNRQNL
jgi:hypothetical protein